MRESGWRALGFAWASFLALLAASPLYFHALHLELTHQPGHDGSFDSLGVSLFALASLIWLIPSLVLALLVVGTDDPGDETRMAWTTSAFSFAVGLVGLYAAVKGIRPVIGTYSEQARLELVASTVVAGLPLIAGLLTRRGTRRPPASSTRPSSYRELALPAARLLGQMVRSLPWIAWTAVACLFIGACLYGKAYTWEIAARPGADTSFDGLSLLYLFVLSPVWFLPAVAVAVGATVVRDADRRRRLERFCAQWTLGVALLGTAVMGALMAPRIGTYSTGAPLVLLAAVGVCCVPRTVASAARWRQSARPDSIA